MTNPQDLQGLYQFGNDVIYLAWQPVNKVYMYRPISIGDEVKSYSYMRKFSIPFDIALLRITPLVIGWLPTSAIPSDLYPELFI